MVKAVGVWGVVCKVGKCQAEPGFGPTLPLCHFSDGGGVRGPTQRSVSQGGDPGGLELGAGWVEVALARNKGPPRPVLVEFFVFFSFPFPFLCGLSLDDTA